MEVVICIAMYLMFVMYKRNSFLKSKARAKAVATTEVQAIEAPKKSVKGDSVDMTPPVMQQVTPVVSTEAFKKLDADFLQSIKSVDQAPLVNAGKRRKVAAAVVEILATQFEAQWYSLPGITTRGQGEPNAVRSTDPKRIALSKKLKKAAIAANRNQQEIEEMERLERHLLWQGLI